MIQLIEIKDKKIYLDVPFDDKEMIKTIPGRKWVKKSIWSLPYDMDTIRDVYTYLKLEIPALTPNKSVTGISSEYKTSLLRGLYSHQIQSVNKATPFFADLSEPGTGKTLVQIILMLIRQAYPVLVICPKSIMEAVWVEQLKEFKIIPHILNNGSKTIKDRILGYISLSKRFEQQNDIFIINYEMVPYVINELLKIDWQFIILDESTKIKNPMAKRSKQIMKLRDKTKYRSIMTGTVAPNSLLDVFNQIKFIDPALFGEGYYAFRQRYFNQGGYMNYEWFVKPDTLFRIKERIKECSVQHHKRDCIDLPPMVSEIRKIELSKTQQQHYDQMKNEFLLILKDETITAPFIITQMMKLREICSGFIYSEENVNEIKDQTKIKSLFEVLEQIGEERVIIFCHFNNSIKYLEKKLDGKYTFASFYGGTKTKDKQQALNDFETFNIQILIANPASAGHGLNLAFCSNVIYYEIDWNLEHHIQSKQRIERIGQKNKMTVYFLLMKKTIEEYIYKKLKAKENILKKLDVNELIKNI